jgi:sulfur transfer protein SufE
VVDGGDAVDIFYPDVANAFDKIPQQRLLTKLRAKGVDDVTVN